MIILTVDGCSEISWQLLPTGEKGKKLNIWHFKFDSIQVPMYWNKLETIIEMQLSKIEKKHNKT
jgi:hypothetical protein